MQYLPLSMRKLTKLFLLFFGFLLAYRLSFLILNWGDIEQSDGLNIFKALYLGTKFDIRLTLLILTPYFILHCLPFIKLYGKGPTQKIYGGSLILLKLTLIFIYICDFSSYSYLSTRLNSEYLKFLKSGSLLISLEMVWQTYPVIWLTLLIALIGIFFAWLAQKTLFIDEIPVSHSRKKKAILWTVFFFVWAGGIYGKFAWYPLRWSEAFFSPHNATSQLALNPVLYFFDTLKFDRKMQWADKAREYYPIVAEHLDVDDKDVENLNFLRTRTPKKKIVGNPNIVIIIMESMVAFKSSLFGNKLNPTPYFDDLAKKGMLFKKFYVPSQATARSIFAAVTGNADLSRVKTGSRNPFLVNQQSVMNEFKSWEKFYFIGGSANWGNIRGIFSNNIKNINIYEEGSFDSPRTDVWGISDFHLFQEAHKVFEKQKKPFFAVVQSAGFHRPYTIPDDHGDFVVEKLEASQYKPWGFVSSAEYNSLKFQDYALGTFFKLAKKSSYYENTLFFIYGDHGLPDNNAKNVSAGANIHDLENFHVPFLIYGPKFIEPQVTEQLMSQLDVLPTVASLLGLPYRNTTLGRDIFDPKTKKSPYLFTYYWYQTPETFGLLSDDFYYRGNPDEGKLYHYNSDDPGKDHSLDMPDKFKEFEDLARGLFYTSKYLMYNNPKLTN